MSKLKRTTDTHNCIFCEVKPNRIIDRANNFIVIRDAFPVTEGHTLFISKRCVVNWFELNAIEQSELNVLLAKHRQELLKKFPSVTGFNIGMNCGESAGQTVMHFHAHLIPRRNGDCEDPRGGVRGVIALKQKY